jgi:hypothetical protein
MAGVFFGRSPLRWWLRFSFAGRGRCRWLFRRRWPGPACLNHSRESPSRRFRASQERNGEFFGEERDDRTPHARGLRTAVQQDYRRAMSGGEGADGLVSCSGGRQGRASKRIAREFQRLLVAGGTIDGLSTIVSSRETDLAPTCAGEKASATLFPNRAQSIVWQGASDKETLLEFGDLSRGPTKTNGSRPGYSR